MTIKEVEQVLGPRKRFWLRPSWESFDTSFEAIDRVQWLDACIGSGHPLDVVDTKTGKVLYHSEGY